MIENMPNKMDEYNYKKEEPHSFRMLRKELFS